MGFIVTILENAYRPHVYLARSPFKTLLISFIFLKENERLCFFIKLFFIGKLYLLFNLLQQEQLQIHGQQ